MQASVRHFSLLDGDPLESATLHYPLGSGRHGTVFLGQLGEETNAELVAIKIARSDSDVTAEVEVLRALAHPNIVKVIAAEPPSTLAVEYCPGGTLGDLLANAPLSLLELRYVFEGVLAALDHVHDSGWIHGDLSPANIGIRPVGGSALFDFSTARLADGSKLAQGTEQWAGPQRLATPSFDVRCAAAIARDALDTGSLEPSVEATLASLNTIVGRADSGESVAVDDLRLALGLGTTTRISTDIARRLGVGGTPPPSATRDFGPRPGGQGENVDETTTTASNTGVIIAIVAALVAIAGLAVEFLIPSGQQVSALPLPAMLNERTVAAESTMSANNASWDATTGTLTITRANEPELWKVGEPGDLAAIGDWNCDGIPTLGVLRPSNGTWFTFASWRPGAESTVEHLDIETPADGLDVLTRADGCTTPQMS